MKRSIINVLIAQILLFLFIFLFVTSYPQIDGKYIVPKEEIWVIVCTLIIFLLSHAVEYFVDKKYIVCKIIKGVLYALEFIFIDILLANQYESSFVYINLIVLFNIFLQVVSLIIYYALIKKKLNETGEPAIPDMCFSTFSLGLHYALYFLIPAGAICACIYTNFWNIGLRLLVILIPSLIVLEILLIVINTGIEKPIYQYESTLNYQEFDDKIKKIYSRHLSLETINYIRIFEARYKSMINRKQSDYFYSTLISTPKEMNTGLVMYYETFLLNYLLDKNIVKFNKKMVELDSLIASSKKKDKNVLYLLKHKYELLKELLIDHKTNNEILNFYSINPSNSMFLRIQKSFVLYIYYSLNNDLKKAEECEQVIKETKSLLPALYEKYLEFKDDITLHEKSCGAVVYKIEGEDVLVLLEKMVGGHTSIPKGHVEGDETEIETALREIKEETSLDVSIDTNFREEISYSPKPRTIKKVVFFVAEYLDGEPIPQEEEVNECFFIKGELALKQLTHKSDVDVVKKALIYINDKIKKEAC